MRAEAHLAGVVEEVELGDPLNCCEAGVIQEAGEKGFNKACLSGYHPHPLYVVCTHFPE